MAAVVAWSFCKGSFIRFPAEAEAERPVRVIAVESEPCRSVRTVLEDPSLFGHESQEFEIHKLTFDL